ncbi:MULTISPECIES: DUF5675 family protein [Flavobacteriaceae]|uniref:DUF5675 domain-containing protein n=1 Tax=Dokdonia sinensis TaxID=2479847 RepID=A0A3M0G8Q6_9FLAO|nr:MULTISPECIES: DUF5675 family protein [Flavobacteriaceae]RMB60537.1 hypothetical protein EAX61_06865 [Dokdonia sinensis]
MDLILKRSYFEKGTNGALFINGRFICFTIELPWQDNRRNVSCVPEGAYEVVPRISKRFRNHLHILNVPGRSLILIHPANDAAKELRGCLSPVSQLSGIGTGWLSRAALQKLLSLCYQAYDRKEKVTLTIKS